MTLFLSFLFYSLEHHAECPQTCCCLEVSVVQSIRYPDRIETRVVGIMNSVGNLALFLVIFVECVFAVPYGFGGVSRQEDAIVIDAAPSFTPVGSNPVHTPSCRHRIHYTPSSSSGSNTRQSYQPMHQSYHAYQPMREIVSNYNTYDSYGTVSRNPSHSLESPSYFQRQNDIQDEGYKVSNTFLKV